MVEKHTRHETPTCDGPRRSGSITDTFLHAADLHLGAPLGSLSGSIGESKAAHLRDLASRAFDDLVRTAIDHGASFVVLAGDVYDGAEREVASQFRFHNGLMALSQAGIPTFIVHGNHDPVLGRFTPVRTLPPSVTVFDPGPVQHHTVTLRSGSTIRVAGVSFATRHEQENLALRFRELDRLPDLATIGVMHANVGGASGYERYAECSIDDLMASPVDYWALGHIHKRSVVTLSDGTRYAYPGNLQGRGSKPSECEPKGVLLVPVDGLVIGEPEFIECDTVRFIRNDVDVSEATDLGDVVDLVAEAALDASAGASGRPVLVYSDLVGATTVHRTLITQDPRVLTDEVRSHLGDALGDGDIVRIRVRSRPEITRDQLLDRGDLLSAVLRSIDGTPRTLDAVLERLDPGVIGGRTITVLNDMVPAGDEDGRSALATLIWERAEQLLIDHMEDLP